MKRSKINIIEFEQLTDPISKNSESQKFNISFQTIGFLNLFFSLCYIKGVHLRS